MQLIFERSNRSRYNITRNNSGGLVRSLALLPITLLDRMEILQLSPARYATVRPPPIIHSKGFITKLMLVNAR